MQSGAYFVDTMLVMSKGKRSVTLDALETKGLGQQASAVFSVIFTQRPLVFREPCRLVRAFFSVISSLKLPHALKQGET